MIIFLKYKYYVLFILLSTVQYLNAQDKMYISPDKMDYINKTSASTQDVLNQYYELFKYKKLKGFVHVDILSAGGDSDDETSYKVEVPTTNGIMKTRLIQGNFVVGIPNFFIMTHGFEFPTYSSTEPDFEFKDTSVNSYLEFEYFKILGSVIFKKYQKTTVINGVSYFDIDNTEDTVQYYLKGELSVFDLGISYDTLDGLEKVFLEYEFKTDDYGDFNIKFINGYLPIEYNDLQIYYENKLNRKTKLSILSKYRLHKNQTDIHSDGLVNSSIDLDLKFKKNLKIKLSASSSNEFTDNNVFGYSVLFKIKLDLDKKQYIDFFIGWSKNSSENLARVPIKDVQLVNMGLTYSLY